MSTSLPYLATPERGEIFISVVGRTSKTLRCFSSSELREAVMGSSGRKYGFALPRHLHRFICSARGMVDLNTETILAEHSLFPLYAVLMDGREREQLALRCCESGPGIRTAHSEPRAAVELKACPLCVRDQDQTSVGGRFLVRLHIVPQVTCCPKHGVRLVPVACGCDIQDVLNALEAMDPNGVLTDATEEEIWMAKQIEFLLDQNRFYPGRHKFALAFRWLCRVPLRDCSEWAKFLSRKLTAEADLEGASFAEAEWDLRKKIIDIFDPPRKPVVVDAAGQHLPIVDYIRFSNRLGWDIAEILELTRHIIAQQRGLQAERTRSELLKKAHRLRDQLATQWEPPNKLRPANRCLAGLGTLGTPWSCKKSPHI